MRHQSFGTSYTTNGINRSTIIRYQNSATGAQEIEPEISNFKSNHMTIKFHLSMSYLVAILYQQILYKLDKDEINDLSPMDMAVI